MTTPPYAVPTTESEMRKLGREFLEAQSASTSSDDSALVARANAAEQAFGAAIAAASHTIDENDRYVPILGFKDGFLPVGTTIISKLGESSYVDDDTEVETGPNANGYVSQVIPGQDSCYEVIFPATGVQVFISKAELAAPAAYEPGPQWTEEHREQAVKDGFDIRDCGDEHDGGRWRVFLPATLSVPHSPAKVRAYVANGGDPIHAAARAYIEACNPVEWKLMQRETPQFKRWMGEVETGLSDDALDPEDFIQDFMDGVTPEATVERARDAEAPPSLAHKG